MKTIKLNWFGWICLLVGAATLAAALTFTTIMLTTKAIDCYQQYRTQQVLEQQTENMVDVICTISGVPIGNELRLFSFSFKFPREFCNIYYGKKPNYIYGGFYYE